MKNKSQNQQLINCLAIKASKQDSEGDANLFLQQNLLAIIAKAEGLIQDAQFNSMYCKKGLIKRRKKRRKNKILLGWKTKGTKT